MCVCPLCEELCTGRVVRWVYAVQCDRIVLPVLLYSAYMNFGELFVYFNAVL